MCVCVAGAHVCRAPGAVKECRTPGVVRSVVLQVLGRMCVVLQVLGLLQELGQVLGLVLQVQVLGLGLGRGLGRGLLCSSLFIYPQNFIFANAGQPRSLKINMYIKRYRNHPGGPNMLFTRDDIEKLR